MLSLQNIHTISEEKRKKRKAPSKRKTNENIKKYVLMLIQTWPTDTIEFECNVNVTPSECFQGYEPRRQLSG